MDTICTFNKIKTVTESALALLVLLFPFLIIMLVLIRLTNDVSAINIIIACFYITLASIIISAILSFVSRKIIIKQISKELMNVVVRNMKKTNVHGTVYVKFKKIKKMNNVCVNLCCTYTNTNVIYEAVCKELKSYERTYNQILGDKVKILYSEIGF